MWGLMKGHEEKRTIDHRVKFNGICPTDCSRHCLALVLVHYWFYVLYDLLLQHFTCISVTYTDD